MYPKFHDNFIYWFDFMRSPLAVDEIWLLETQLSCIFDNFSFCRIGKEFDRIEKIYYPMLLLYDWRKNDNKKKVLC